MPHLDLFHGLGAGATPRLAAAGPGACLRVASPLWASARVRHRLPSGSPLAGHPATQPLHPPTSPPPACTWRLAHASRHHAALQGKEPAPGALMA